ncbi:hypothetical protein Droror1_Dr00006140 [Drosera rotundifolia]
MALSMPMEIGLEGGFRTALSEFVLRQLQLAPVFFTFTLGTRTHYYGRTLLHGGAKYRVAGRGFVVFHAKFAENYRLYSRSHFPKGKELLILLIVYEIFGQPYRSVLAYVLITVSRWFMVGTWLFAPFLLNPSGFGRQKIVDELTDWNTWISNRGVEEATREDKKVWWIPLLKEVDALHKAPNDNDKGIEMQQDLGAGALAMSAAKELWEWKAAGR